MRHSLHSTDNNISSSSSSSSSYTWVGTILARSRSSQSSCNRMRLPSSITLFWRFIREALLHILLKIYTRGRFFIYEREKRGWFFFWKQHHRDRNGVGWVIDTWQKYKPWWLFPRSGMLRHGAARRFTGENCRTNSLDKHVQVVGLLPKQTSRGPREQWGQKAERE